jgi:hypothetical protein
MPYFGFYWKSLSNYIGDVEECPRCGRRKCAWYKRILYQESKYRLIRPWFAPPWQKDAACIMAAINKEIDLSLDQKDTEDTTSK